MHRSVPASIIAEAVKLGLAPLLRDEGFRKRRTDFYLHTEESTGLVSIHSSRRNSSCFSRFTLNLGRYFPALEAAMAEVWTLPGAEPWNPKIYDCQLRRRIGELFPPYGDFWWEATLTSDANELAAKLADTWQQYGGPWMKRTSTLRGAVMDLEAQYLYWPAAAGRLMLGEREEASRLAKADVESLKWEGAQHPAMAAFVERSLKEIQDWCARHELEM
jgi:hypothetical protein